MPPREENSDATTNRVLELRARVNAELEKSVAAVVAELTTFSSDLKQALSDELLVILSRFEEFLHLAENDLDQNTVATAKQLSEVTSAAGAAILAAGRETREALDTYAAEALANLQALMIEQEKEIDFHMSMTAERFKEEGNQAVQEELESTLERALATVRSVWQDSEATFAQTTGDIKAGFARAIAGAESSIANQAAACRALLTEKSKSKIDELEKTRSQVETEIKSRADAAIKEIVASGEDAREELGQSLEDFRQQMDEMCQDHEQSPRNLKEEVKDKFASRLEDVCSHAAREIAALSSEGQSRISARCQQAENALSKLEDKYVSRLEHLLQRVDLALAEVVVCEPPPQPGTDPEFARGELKSNADALLSAVSESSGVLKSKYRRLSNMLRAKIASSHSDAVAQLEQQARSSQRRIQQSISGFREDLSRLEPQLWEIEEQGMAAARAASVYTQTLLSLGDE